MTGGLKIQAPRKCKLSLLMISSRLTGFSAGFSEKPEEIKSVQWCKAPENKQALDDKLAWRRRHKEKQGVDPNCITAETASALGGVSLRK